MVINTDRVSFPLETPRNKKKKKAGSEIEFEARTGASFEDTSAGDIIRAQEKAKNRTGKKNPALEDLNLPRNFEPASPTDIAFDKISSTPGAFGLDPSAQTDTQTNIPATQQPPVTGQALLDNQQQTPGRSIFDVFAPERAQGADIAATAIPLGGPGGGFKIGKTVTTNAKRAVQLATAAKNRIAASTALKTISAFGVGLFGLVYSAEKAAGFFTRKVDDQQQSLNTLGQITSTIVGDSTSSAGDWREGLAELKSIKSQILELEEAIKAGTIAEAQIKISGQVIDLNADVYDQLATVDEGIRGIQSFALEGQFPELTPFELQSLLRQLESEGYLEPVDLTQNRRPTT